MKVFISSTSGDLKEHRQAAAAVVRDAQCEAVVMEHGPADPRPIVDVCREWVHDCDLVILIVAFRRGWVPGAAKGGDTESSITALEIAEADRLKRPVLAFLADDNWPGRLWDDDSEARAWVKAFRANLNRAAKFFAWETDAKLPSFRALISQELANYRNRSQRHAGSRAEGVMDARVKVDLSVALRTASPPARPTEPYPLLGPYAYPATFGGRDADIAQLGSLVTLPPLVLCVHAVSGTGKSSLLLAGLAPWLRDRGYTVAIVRSPGDPQLAQTLLRDVLEADVEVSDADEDLADRFAAWVGHAYCLSGKPIVFVIDQVDDVLRSAEKRGEALARLGVLMAATAQRLPGVQAFACKWVLCYRQECHGDVRAWLEDVLEHARARHWKGLERLPYDLSDTQRFHDWVLPVVGKAAAGESGQERTLRAFREAIEKPLRESNGYPYRFPTDGIERLAAVFARARQSQPEAPLVPELQVVLNKLLEPVHGAATDATPGTTLWADVPSEEHLKPLIKRALADHLTEALQRAFPTGRDTSAGRTARTRALIALERLADAEGRRSSGLDEGELIRMIGEDGAAVLESLSGPTVRLVVRAADGTYVLSHDQLAEVVVQLARDEAARGNLVVDQRLLDVRRVIAQKLALHQGDGRDESALTLSHEQRALIAANEDAVLVTPEQQAWWKTSETHRSRQTRQVAWWAAAFMLMVLAAGYWGYGTYQGSRVAEVQANLYRVFSSERPDFALFAENVNSAGFNVQALRFDDEAVQKINPELFAASPWLDKGFAPGQLLDVIERGYPLFVRSPRLFGAMSFAVEEVFVRSEDNAIKKRASTLAGTVRAAFVAYHKERTTGFHEPPERLEADSLNEFVRIPPGNFHMGAEDITDDEKPVHAVSVSEFRMQKHEVTNAEYVRFDPTHSFEPDKEHHPVTNVSWHEANGYAAWLGASLPTEAEWEYAARGTGTSSGRDYPWPQGELDRTRAVYNASRTERVGSRPEGRTPEELDDMAGNAWEWCRDWFAPYPQSAENFSDPWGPVAGAETDSRVVRGGSFSFIDISLRAAYRHRDTPDSRDYFIGFRVVSSRLRP